MKKHPLFAAALVTTLATTLAAGASAGDRERLDADWRFHPGDPAAAEQVAFDDAAWQPVDLPHDWSIPLPTNRDAPSGEGGGYFEMGVGWYRKTLVLPSSWQGRHVAIEFEGVYQRPDVWLDGKKVGHHDYGYTPFRAELGDQLEVGVPHTLAVRVDNSEQPNCRWYSGSGIYRHVWLAATHDARVVPDSLYVRTKSLSADKAELAVSAAIENRTSEAKTLLAKFACYAPNGHLVWSDEQKVDVQPGQSATVDSRFGVASPQVWSPEHPDMYRLSMRVAEQQGTVDEATTDFGIRTVRVDTDRGLLLNGQPLKLYGGNVHHDNGPLGAAAFDRAEWRRVELLKAAGFNAIRTAHNPPSVVFLDACDRLGMLVIDEAFDGWRQAKTKYDYSTLFDDHWQQDLSAMVRRDRNHPAIVLWSIGNEMFERGEPEAAVQAKKMVEVVRKLDPTRAVTLAANGLGAGNWAKLDPLFATLDVAGYNYESARYAEDRERLPTRVMFSSESFPVDMDSSYAPVRDLPYVIGDFVWSGMDYLGEAGIGCVYPPGSEVLVHWQGNHFPWHGAICGDLDITGFRKPISHFRNIVWQRGERLYAAVVAPPSEPGRWQLSRWAIEPAVASWTWPGQEGHELVVQVCSRWSTVTLELNGRKIAEWHPRAEDGFFKEFQVPYEPGQLQVVGCDDTGQGQETIELQTAGPPAKIHLAVDRMELAADGQDLAFVRVEVCDAEGNVVPTSSASVSFSLAGPGAIAAIGSGDLASREPYGQNPRRVYQGQAIVVLRSAAEPGELVLSASAEGLEPAQISISAVE